MENARRCEKASLAFLFLRATQIDFLTTTIDFKVFKMRAQDVKMYSLSKQTNRDFELLQKVKLRDSFVKRSR